VKNVIVFIVVIVLLVGGMGWYLDWFSVSRETTEDGKTNVEVTIDKDNIKDDVDKAKEKVGDAIDKNDPRDTGKTDQN